MEITINTDSPTPKRQENLKNLRTETKKRFPNHKAEDILIELLKCDPDVSLIGLYEDLIGFVFFKDKVRFEIDRHQPLCAHIENHKELLLFSPSFQQTLKQRFLMILEG